MLTHPYERAPARRRRLVRVGLAAWFAVALSAPGSAAAQTGGTFTQAQAAAGRTVYEQSCAQCHMSDLTGAFEAPELAGPNFTRVWGARPVNELIDLMNYLALRAQSERSN